MPKQTFDYKLVRKLLTENKQTYQDLSNFFSEKGVDLSIDVIKHWFRKDDKTRANPEVPKIPIIAEFLGVEASSLLLGFSDEYASVKYVPIVGEASCGMPITNEYQENAKTYYHGDFWHKDLYALKACGDSMAPDIEDGDEVVCDPNVTVLDGDIVHYVIDNENAIKIYFENIHTNFIELIPYNQQENFKTKYIQKGSEEHAKITITKVVSINKLRINNRKARLRLVGK